MQMLYQEKPFQQEQPQLLMNIMIITCCAPTAKGPQIPGHEYMSQEIMGWCFQKRNRSQQTLLGVGWEIPHELVPPECASGRTPEERRVCFPPVCYGHGDWVTLPQFEKPMEFETPAGLTKWKNKKAKYERKQWMKQVATIAEFSMMMMMKGGGISVLLAKTGEPGECPLPLPRTDTLLFSPTLLRCPSSSS